MHDDMLKTYAVSGRNIIVLCGRYEGVDQRVLEHWDFKEICLGDFVLCGGDIPAMAFIEGCVRYLPGVVGNAQSVKSESFCHGLLEIKCTHALSSWAGNEAPGKILPWIIDSAMATSLNSFSMGGQLSVHSTIVVAGSVCEITYR